MKRFLLSLMIMVLCGVTMLACTPSEPKDPPTVNYEVTYNSVTVIADSGCEYKLGTGEWQDEPTFTGLSPAETHVLFVRYKATAKVPASQPTRVVITLNKAPQSTPTFTTEVTSTSITVLGLTDAEYRINDGAWQSSNVFSNLEPATTYTVSARIKETYNYLAGDEQTQDVTTAEAQIIDVYIISGQSNALGISNVSEIGLTQSYSNVMMYYDGENGKANGKQAPYWTYVRPGQGYSSGQFGPEIGMSQILSQYYPENSNRKVAIIKYTWGGTSMWDWWLSPSSVRGGLGNQANVNFYKGITGDENCARLYYDLITTVHEGIAALPHGYQANLCGLAWMQGESDACALASANAYETILTNFINDLRVEFDAPNMPFAIGRINSVIAGYEPIVIEAEKNVCSKLANCSFIDTSDLEMGFVDWWHFRARDMVTLGNRFASSLMNYHDYGAIASLESIALTTSAGSAPSLPQFGWVTTEDGKTRLAPLVWDTVDASVYASAGSATLTGKALCGTVETPFTATLTVDNAAKIDGNLTDTAWADVTSHSLTYYQDIYSNFNAPQYPVSASMMTFATADGMYFAIDVKDTQISNSYVGSGFDLELFKDDGLELYLDASGSDVTTLTNKSITLWLTSSNILRIYDGANSSGGYHGVNRYQEQDARFNGILRAITLNGTANQTADVDVGYTYEIFVPYSVFGGETDLSKYKFALGLRSLSWTPTGYENPYAVLGQEPNTPSNFNNANIQTWLDYDVLSLPLTLPSLDYVTTSTSITVTPVAGCEYKLDDGEWTTNNVFTNLNPATQYTVYIRWQAKGHSAASAAVSETLALQKLPQTTPSFTVTAQSGSLTATLVEGAEYRIKDGTWQDSNVLSGLAPNTTYTVQMRLKETSIYAAGNIVEMTATTLSQGELDVYILAGQSNALGISTSTEIGLTQTYPEVMIYYDGENGKANGKQAPAWTTVKPGQGSDAAHFGPEIGMAQLLSQYTDTATDRKVAIIKYTWGGTAMWDWWLSPTTVAAGIGNHANVNFYKGITGDENCARLYYDLITTVHNGIAALDGSYNINYRGFAWMQGEHDSITATAANAYETVLTNFINDLRAEFNAPDMPFAIGRINCKIAGYENTVIAAEKAVCNKVTNCSFVDTTDLEMGFLDWWHFRARDMITLGNRFAGALMGYHNYGTVASVESITLNAGAGAMPNLPQFGWVTTADNKSILAPLTWDSIDASVYATTGAKSITGTAKLGSSQKTFTATLNVHNGASVDGVLNETAWQTATKHNIVLSAIRPVSATFQTVSTNEGLYFAIDVKDTYIENNFVNTASFDWDLCLNDGIELYIDASGSSVNALTSKSIALWITASDIVRIYDGHDETGGYGSATGANDNVYLTQDPRFTGIQHEVSINGTANQDSDVDTGYTIEVFVPFEAFGETDINKYRVGAGIRSLAWFPGQNPDFEIPWGTFISGFNNGNIQTWPLFNTLR